MFDPVVIPPPSRWDEPFGPEMTDPIVAGVLTQPPFDRIDPKDFVKPFSLHAIIKNDARLLQVNKGGIVIRERDFGTSVFFILEGQVRVVVGEDLSTQIISGAPAPRRSFFSALAQSWRNHKAAEVRVLSETSSVTRVGFDVSGDTAQRLYFADVEDILQRYPDAVIRGPGDVFGELSALGRSPRTATVFAETPARILEMRWQGFRDILKRNAELKEYVDTLYRQRSLKTHLHASPLFSHLSDEELNEVAEKTLFESYGDYDWHVSFKRRGPGDNSALLVDEPIIAEEDHYADGLIILAAGFGRSSVQVGHGHYTRSYLCIGDTFGLDETRHNWRNPRQPCSWKSSLRAIGYAHVLRVPTSVVEQYVLERLPASSLPPIGEPEPSSSPLARHDEGAGRIGQDVLEFLVERRFINGTATMLIDMDRCTRCDDCVKACAAGHDNNPRFIRHGPIFDHYMVANACMQCTDPVCMIGCPTGAIHRRGDEGQVVINDATCIGCATCADSCPYDNIRMVSIRDEQESRILNQKTLSPVLRATKCDLCAEQMRGVAPACQTACPHDALIRMDMRDKTALAAWLHQ